MWLKKQKSIFFQDLAKIPGKKKGNILMQYSLFIFIFPNLAKFCDPK